MKPKFATKVTEFKSEQVSRRYTIECSADISTEEACTSLLGN